MTALTPPLLFLHGFAQSAATWDEVRALLSDIPTATLEWSGHGARRDDHKREHFGFGWTQMELYEAGYQLWKTHPDRPKLILIGYSMGGRILAAAVTEWRLHSEALDARYDPPFSALMFESAGLGPSSESERLAFAARNLHWADELRRDGIEAFFDQWETLPLFASQASMPADRRRRLREERLANDAEALALSLEEAGAHQMPPAEVIEEVLAAESADGTPILYLAGALDPRYRAIAETLKASMKAPFDVVIVDGVGHNVHWEAPMRFADVVRRFATKVGAIEDNND